MKKLTLILMSGLFGLLIISCSENFLDSKPSKSMVIPKTLNDLKGMLDQVNTMNQAEVGLQQIMDGDLYVPDNIYINRSDFEQLPYTWEDYDPNIFKSDWNSSYSSLIVINSVISIGLEYEPVSQLEVAQLNAILGRAYFLRASKIWYLLQQFALVYEPGSTNDGLGVVLKLNNNVLERLPRSTIQQGYDQVLSDFMSALELLPEESDYVIIPNKRSAEAFLARVYLSMSNYEKALEFSNNVLTKHSRLLDYNELSKPAPNINPFPRFNDEVIFHAQLPTYGMHFMSNSGGYVLPELIDQYGENDLRKFLYFQPFGEYMRLNGSYTGLFIGFGGLATDEMYLIRAESKARTGDISGAMNDLNTLLVTRWETGTYFPYQASNETDALHIILNERRKQLLHRGLRWTDLKRLNLDPRFQQTLTRTVMGVTYTLPPNDLRYAILLPIEEIQNNDQIVQNPR